MYDLSSLRRTGNQNNWLSTEDTRENNKYRYLVNVCAPLINEDANCGPFSGVCQELSDNNTAYDAGYPASPVVVNGTLMIVYNTTDKNRASEIEFHCVAKGLGHPVFVGEIKRGNVFVYRFLWETTAACPVQDDEDDDDDDGCSFLSPVNGQVFNFTSLNQIYTVNSQFYTFKLAVCQAASSDPQCASSGACQYNANSTQVVASMGQYAARSFSSETENTITLRYTNGDTCRSNGNNRSTVIQFVCDPKATGYGNITYLSEGHNCSYIFMWATNLVCSDDDGDAPCDVIDNGNHYDLNGLSKSTGSWAPLGFK